MPATYIPIASTTLSSDTTTVTFSSIPQTYTDLVLRITSRATLAQNSAGFAVRFNGATTNVNMSGTWLREKDTVVSSFRDDGLLATGGSTITADTFGTAEVYFANYAGNTNKVYSSFFVIENNNATTGSQIAVQAGLFRDTAALTEIKVSNFDIVSGSSFHLYGIKKD